MVLPNTSSKINLYNSITKKIKMYLLTVVEFIIPIVISAGKNLYNINSNKILSTISIMLLKSL